MTHARGTALPGGYREALASGGFAFGEKLATPPQLSAIDWRVGIERWRKEKDTFLVSDGCRFYADEQSPYRDEYFIMEGEEPGFDLAVLESVMALHMKSRSFAPLDELELAALVPQASGTVIFHVPAHLPYPLVEGSPSQCLTYIDYDLEMTR